MEKNSRGKLEHVFEEILWQGRLVTLLGVVFSFLSAVALFLAGSRMIGIAIFHAAAHPSQDLDHIVLMVEIIAGVDLYLIAVVLLIFSFGVYELFISKIDTARHNREINILEIKNLDDLKNRLLKVIVMALVVHFFKVILTTEFDTPLETLYLGLAIFVTASATYFIRRIE